MDPCTGSGKDQVKELVQARSLILNHLLSFITYMCLNCAVQLGIPDLIHSHGKPITSSDLASALPIHPCKADFLPWLMRLLAHSGYFSYESIPDDKHGSKGFALTTSSRLLLKDHPFSMMPFLFWTVNPFLISIWFDLSKWFQNDSHTIFSAIDGSTVWQYLNNEPNLLRYFNDSMANDSKFIAKVLLEKCEQGGLFEGIKSIVDVGGGKGEMARAIAIANPHIQCTVLDLPQALEGLQGTHNLTFMPGDMFEAIPSANAVLLKWILHNWSDEESVRILKQCKKAITSTTTRDYEGQAKVIIIDMVLNEDEDESMERETQLLFDMKMLVLFGGKERSMAEWEKLFLEAGFTGGYKIFAVIGSRYVIEVYP